LSDRYGTSVKSMQCTLIIQHKKTNKAYHRYISMHYAKSIPINPCSKNRLLKASSWCDVDLWITYFTHAVTFLYIEKDICHFIFTFLSKSDSSMGRVIRGF
jgi:hypothetical protein